MFKNFEQHLMSITEKISTNRYLVAIRDSLISTIPITMISSIALLLVYLPWPNFYVEFMANNLMLRSFLINFNQMGMSLLSIYLAFILGVNLSKSYNLNPVSAGISSLFSFLMSITVIKNDVATGLNVAGGLLPAVGFALLLQPIMNIKYYIFCGWFCINCIFKTANSWDYYIRICHCLHCVF